MESSNLASWQFENFSTAEFLSPPVSPSPPSPSLFEINGGLALSPVSSSKGKTLDLNRPISRRAQLASSLLKDLEHLEEVSDVNDLGMNWDEESVNLGLFEELEEIEYTPPTSPKRSLKLSDAAHDLSDNTDMVNIQFRQSVIEPAAADISALTAEFQAILESLPKDNTDALSQVLEIAGIPTTIIDGEALVPVELDLTNMDVDDFEVHVITDTDDNIIDESELYGMSDLSSQGSPASSVYSNYESVVDLEVDHHSDAAQKILDALLRGDVTTAEAYLPDIVQDEDSMSSEDSVCLIEEEPVAGPSRKAVVANTEAVRKPERRGRKPGKKLAKGSPTYIKDKTLRKKEQNKTAATRYRQKKKMEFSVILDTESELHKEQQDLEKKRDDLNREILMVKQLLREVIKARKPQPNLNSLKGKLVTVVGGGITASSLVRNRRK